MTRRRRPATVASSAVGVAALAAILSACGSPGPEKPTAAASRSTTTVPAVTATTGPDTPATTAAPPSTTSTTAGSATASTTPTTPTTPSGGAAAPGTAPANPAAPVDTSIKVYGDCSTASVEPAGIVLACADYGESLSGLKWSTWTASAATGVGNFVYNDCNPSCAAGHQHTVGGIHVTLSAPVAGAAGQEVWSRIHFDPTPPGGFPATESLPTRPV